METLCVLQIHMYPKEKRKLGMLSDLLGARETLFQLKLSYTLHVLDIQHEKAFKMQTTSSDNLTKLSQRDPN